MSFNLQLRDIFFNYVFKIMKTNKDIVVLTNDMGAPSLDQIRNKFKSRLINMGITEQNIVSTAAGLARSGKKVIIYSISTFISLRSFEQIKLNLGVMKIPVVIVTVGSGYSYDIDGPTHHAIDDISVMNTIPNMNIISPCDPIHFKSILRNIFHENIPTYIRLDRLRFNTLKTSNNNYKEGFRKISTGKDLLIISTSNMVHRSKTLAETLKKKIKKNIQVIDFFRLKQFNSQSLKKELNKFKKICIIEEHSIHGGINSILLPLLTNKKDKVSVLSCGIDDQNLYVYGSRKYIHKHNFLDLKSLEKKIIKFLKK